MKFKVLTDNSRGGSALLQAEHGLSFWFEADGDSWMLDTGASDLFLRNAEIMGVSIAGVDHLILSHAHADHTGGLETFIRANDKADIFLSSHIDGRHFYSDRRGSRRDISINYRLLEEYPERFRKVSGLTRLSPSVTLMTDIPEIFPRPSANSTLTADGIPDDFSHELAVLVKEPEGTTVLSSCSHKGILNTLQAASGLVESATCPLKAYVGGLHLVDSDEHHRFESEGDIREIARRLLSDWPGLTVFTGHCTGQHVADLLQEELGEGLVRFHTGFEAESLARIYHRNDK